MKKTVILFIFILFCTTFVAGQSIDLMLSPRLDLAHVIYLSDFSLIERQSAEAFETEFLFQATFTGFTGTEEGELVFQLLKNNQLVAQATSNMFTMPAGDHSFNNMQLNQGVIIGGQEVRFEVRNIEKPSDDFQNEILSGNKLPRGRYVFRISFAGFTGEAVIDVFNPTYVDLVTPGYLAGKDVPEIIFTDMPTFIFDSDLTDPIALDGNPFKIQVFQKLEQHGSLDEVTTGTPHLEADVGTMVVNYTQFPEAEPLMPGTYLWRVLMHIQTSGGVEVTPSPLYAFTVRDVTDQLDPMDEAVTEDIFELLENIVGTERARAITQELVGYHLSAIRLNGVEITVDQLYDILDNYQGHLVEITDIILQSIQN
jgi:hypothetical protein